jgi:hypothetical protein
MQPISNRSGKVNLDSYLMPLCKECLAKGAWLILPWQHGMSRSIDGLDGDDEDRDGIRVPPERHEGKKVPISPSFTLVRRRNAFSFDLLCLIDYPIQSYSGDC